MCKVYKSDVENNSGWVCLCVCVCVCVYVCVCARARARVVKFRKIQASVSQESLERSS